MKRSLIVAGVLFAAAAATAYQRASAREGRASQTARVERGHYLVDTIGCHDCHTPKKMGPAGPELDLSRLLSGHPQEAVVPTPPAGQEPWGVRGSSDLTAWSGPWGVSFAANLTPDRNTGLGIWTEQMFMSAIRTGRHMGVSRQILPPMPWQSFRNLTDEDLKSVFAYLQSLPPVFNRVPDPVEPPDQTN